jgi:hypothetical protein
MKIYNKSFSVKSSGSARGIEITPEILARINRWSLKELTAEDLYVRRFILAHDAIDRDKERFPKELLQDFADTLPGKSFMFSHQHRDYLPLGLFFDAEIKDLSPEEFKTLTGENPLLPEGQDRIHFLRAWMYMLATGQEDFTRNMDAGIYRHVSIGFGASDLKAVKDEFDRVLYYEYAPPGEAQEGSIVWLGAQPGATVQKALRHDKKTTDQPKGDHHMKTLLFVLGQLLSKSFDENTDEQTVIKEVREAFKAKDTEIEDLKTQLASLKDLAEEGRAYRKGLVEEYTRLKALLGEVGTTPEEQETCTKFAQAFDPAFLKAEIKHMEARAAEKFPSEGRLPGDRGNGKRDKAVDNPLIPEENR